MCNRKLSWLKRSEQAIENKAYLVNELIELRNTNHEEKSSLAWIWQQKK